MNKLNEFLNVKNLCNVGQTNYFVEYDIVDFTLHLHDCSETNSLWFCYGIETLFKFVNDVCINNDNFICLRYLTSDDIYIFIDLQSNQFELYDCVFNKIENGTDLYYKTIKLLVDICN